MCYVCGVVINEYFSAMGIIPSPFDCYQVNRGLKTLALRMRQHSHNGIKVAMFLEKHPSVERVLHPGKYSVRAE